MAPGSTEVRAHLDQGAQRSMSTETRRLDTTDWVRRDSRSREGDWIDYFERHRTPEGICAPRPYLLILGRRRGG
jgi:hypothetical protein